MNHSTLRRSIIISFALLPLSGCGGHSAPEPLPAPLTTDAVLQGHTTPASITLDGDTADWPASSVILADDHYVYVRFAVQDAQYTLQAAPITTAIMLDVDGDKSTGRTGDAEPLSALGVDLEIDFSPHGPSGHGHGVAVYALDNTGRKTPISTADIDFSCSPTYAATWYECRVSRTPSNPGLLPKVGLLSRGTIRGIVATLNSDGVIDGYTDPFAVSAGPVAPGKYLFTRDMPAKPQGAIRVLEYNVEKSSPLSKPQLFRRIFQAAKPDVILLEEWETGDAAALQAWFTAMVSSDVTWNVRKPEGNNSTGGGVAIVTPLPLQPLAGDALTLPAEAAGKNTPHKIRFVGAKITSPIGELIVGCTHLKCCGSKDSPEDQTRMAEARAINACFKAADGDKSAIRVIAGDLNLVGSRPPLDLLRQGLDTDGSDLAVASPMVLGDATLQTWRDPPSGYSAGRLDYFTYSHSNAQIVNAFVLDTSRLTDESLARMGLDRGDCEGSDHLPVIVDIRPIVH